MRYSFLIILLSLLLVFHLKLKSQPPICGANPAMQSTCKQGCIICDIDGFKGRNNSSVAGELPPDFCTTVKHNGQWIAFQAGSNDLTIQFSVSNCQTGRGLEMGLYEGRNCENYQRISMCDTDVRPNTSISFSNTKPLIIGQYYWLVIDGNGGDKCDYELKVTKGTTKIPIIYKPAVLQFENVTCQGKAISLTAAPPIGATEFEWTINNQKIPQNHSTIQHVFGNEGEYDVCVEIYNVCSRGPKSCKKIRVTPPEPIPNTIAICPNGTLSIQNKTYHFGTHLILFRDSVSCDSLVNLTIVPLQVPIPKIFLDDTIQVVLGEGRQIHAGVNYNYLKSIRWTPSIDLNCTHCLDPFLNSLKEGKLFLEVWTEDDCYAIDSVSYTLTKDIRYITPNIIRQKSGKNAVFSIHIAGSIKEVKVLAIYDRWGSEVFRSFNDLHEWDGSSNGKICEEGIYTWIAEMILFDESSTSISGSLMVLKE